MIRISYRLIQSPTIGSRRLMREGKHRHATLILAVLMAIALGIFHWSPIERSTSGSARLVSIEELPDVGEMCDSVARPVSKRPAGLQEDNLFGLLDPASAFASQDVGSTNEVTRPPERYVRDTDP